MAPEPSIPAPRWRWVLIGDGESPHLLKWAQALQASGAVDLWAVSSRGFAPGFDDCVPPKRRLALSHPTKVAGGNGALIRELPRLGRWLAQVDADVLHPHYLTSHGTMAWLARGLWRLKASIVSSAWGSDILLAPRHPVLRALTRRVLRASTLCTSDSAHMADAMRRLGAREVLTFPFGLAELPGPPDEALREPWLVYANRALEPIYRPDRVLDWFEALVRRQPLARLVVAHGGSLRPALERRCAEPGTPLQGRVRFVGLLDAATQARWYRRAGLYLSLPASDSISVSALEAMAHGALPVLSDLPANRELVRHGVNGLIVSEGPIAPAGAGLSDPAFSDLQRLLDRGAQARSENRRWIAENAVFPMAVARFLEVAGQRLPAPRPAPAARPDPMVPADPASPRP